MQKIYIIVESVTFAMKSEKILRKKSIFPLITKTPSHLNIHGCSYSIVINKNDLDNTKEILMQNNIPIKDIKSIEV